MRVICQELGTRSLLVQVCLTQQRPAVQLQRTAMMSMSCKPGSRSIEPQNFPRLDPSSSKLLSLLRLLVLVLWNNNNTKEPSTESEGRLTGRYGFLLDFYWSPIWQLLALPATN